MAAPKEILDLVERFERNREAYKSGQYNEMQLRQEFLDPFFSALGWDMNNSQGYAEAYKDVIHEDSIKVGADTKAPDYCFRIGGTRKFFLEAKKPSIYIKEEIPPAFQLRRYAWSAKLPLSILCDFEEFAIYDTRIKPDKTDKASNARIHYFTYKEYEKQWDLIFSVFSREAVLRGSFDKYAEKSRLKKGTATVDDAFLKEIEDWRDMLARNIALRNADLTQRELNFAVQRTIDRIVFLRICEDRGIEEYGRLQTQLNGTNVYKRLVQLFSQADDRYNSGLFHFQREKDRHEEPDKLTPNISIDDKPLKDIINRLYYPESPYEFSVLSADILGQVYEQFLGKVIRLTDGHRAVVEEKPEVRKAGGVYYTPKYIVDYIVRNTVGALLTNPPLKKGGTGGFDSSVENPPQSPFAKGGNKITPKEASKLKILDPACGSGSFLLGAYQYLLDWHRDWYVNDDPKKWATSKNPTLYQAQGGDYRLTTAERKRILLNNIYGVDIDSQAVEVTKLSLLLKVLEGENNQTLKSQLRMFHERALPDLGDNIKCGNSLIGHDYNKQLTIQPDKDEIVRINAFDWETEYTKIMDAGGFDAIIGNPPYIRIQTMKEWAPVEVELYKDLYQAAATGSYDIYVVFVEKGLRLLSKVGRLGFILPHKFFNAQYGEALRSIIAKGKHLAQVVHFDNQQVFAGATTYTCLLFLDKAGCSECKFIKVDDLNSWRAEGRSTEGDIPSKHVTASEWNFTVGSGADLFEKLNKMPVKLKNVADRIFQGLVTGADPVFILSDVGRGRYFSEATQQEHRIERELMHPLCKGSVNIRRYHVNELTKSILFPYRLVEGKAILLTTKELSDKYPAAWDYLKTNRSTLEARERGKWKHDKWYAFGRSQNLSEMEQAKILTPSIASKASFTLDANDYYYFVGSGGGGGGGYGITLKDSEYSMQYVLGLLNSKLLDVFLKSYSSQFSGGYYAYNRQYIERLPIRTVNFTDPTNKASHDKMVSLVAQMLSLNKQLPDAKTNHEKTALQRQIDATDQQIDQLVYELYGLTEEEIKIVEARA
ncbi:MAG: Eco57I restriction-modification methylase domain-containing protein [Nitrospirae bacterium]|nr:Eco57I restriction-modification methylase domain-containing protein [Nitrospirota bacterium]